MASSGTSIGEETSKPVPSELVVGDRKATSVDELLKLVSDISKAELEDVINPRDNRIANWVEKALDDRKLASKLRKTSSRKEMIRILSEEIKKEDKKEGEEQEENSQNG